jgi:ribosomal protein S27E
MAEMNECPDCASTNIVYSRVENGIICRDCGGVFVGSIVAEKKAVPKPVKVAPKKAAKKPAKKSKAKKKRR